MRDLIPGDVISGSIAFGGVYEYALSKRIANLARTARSFVDVGANMGYFSLLWTAASSEHRVVAFEASERNVRLLAANMAANSLDPRVRVVPKAVSDSAGTVSFDAGPDGQTGWGGIAAGGGATVPSVRLDEELSGERIDVLKIDVEGADALVIRGCEKLLAARRIGHLFFEEHASRMKALGIVPGEARKFLEQHGYTVRPLGRDPGEWEAFPSSAP